MWPASVHALSTDPAVETGGDENLPPPPFSPDSHPPVTSRLRKRRRGVSPAFGERQKKTARWKGKARAEPSKMSDIADTATMNPWALNSGGQEGATQTLNAPPRPHSLSPLSLVSSNHTPYDGLSRTGSHSTSFYTRLNDSASYPTPHQVCDSPLPPSSATGTRDVSMLSPPSPTASIALRQAHPRASPSPEQAMEVDRDDDVTLAGVITSERPLSSAPLRNDFNADELLRTSSPVANVQRLPRDRLSDPGSSSTRPSVYRSPTVEDLPEEGELYGAWRSSDNEARSRTPGNPFIFGSARREHTSSSWTSQTRTITALPSSSRMSSGNRSTVDHEPRRSQRVPSGGDHSGRGPAPAQDAPRLHRLHDSQDSSANSATTSMASSDRIHSLDVFDVGDDANLPDAVRRGGTILDGDEERPTPIPHDGDPEVHRHDPEAHLQGMSDTWVQEVWADPSGTSITLNTFNPRFTRSYGTNSRTALDLRRTITLITGESSFRVIAPDLASGYRGRGPVEWAITGLSSDGVDRILRRRVWSFNSITFFPRRRALDNPRWLLALEGFLEDDADNIGAAVRSTFERPQVRQRIEQMIRANPEFNHTPMAEAFRRVMSTLRITIYKLDNETVVANVFLRPPTLSVRVWRRWIQELRGLTFGSFHTAVARVRRISSCAGCLGVDHPSHLCPFTHMPGWNGPETAGGADYSVDGRERRGRQQMESVLENSRPGSSSARTAGGEGDWRDNGHARERAAGRDRYHDQGRSGPPRRGRKDTPGQLKYGRDSYRREVRR